MKFLVIVGTPTFSIPHLGICLQADERFSSVNSLEVITKLAETGHAVTMLTFDSFHIHDESFLEKVKLVTASTYDELCIKLRYMAKTVQYDCIVSLLKMPFVQDFRLYASDVPFDGSDPDFLLEDVTHEEPRPRPNDVWMRFSDPHEETSAATDVIHTLETKGANIVCLEQVPSFLTEGQHRELMNNRLDGIRCGRPTMVVIDSCHENPAARGVYILGKNGGNFVQETRVLEFIVSGAVEAATISCEMRELIICPDLNKHPLALAEGTPE